MYIFYFADHFSSICLSRHCLQFDFDLVIRVVYFVCIGPFKYTGPIDIALSLFASYKSQCSAHNQIPPRVLTMEDAYEVRILNTFTRT